MHAWREMLRNVLAKAFYALEYDLQPLPKSVECVVFTIHRTPTSRYTRCSGHRGDGDDDDDGPPKRPTTERSTVCFTEMSGKNGT